MILRKCLFRIPQAVAYPENNVLKVNAYCLQDEEFKCKHEFIFKGKNAHTRHVVSHETVEDSGYRE